MQAVLASLDASARRAALTLPPANARLHASLWPPGTIVAMRLALISTAIAATAALVSLVGLLAVAS
jgi:hypothetical protein